MSAAQSSGPAQETYHPWTVVNVIFHHLVDQGLHPTLGDNGHPGKPAAELLRALGIEPAAEGNAQVKHNINEQLGALRSVLLEDD